MKTDARLAIIRDEIVAVDGEAPSPDSPRDKHLKMGRSPFRFFRGSPALYYADLASGVVTVPAALLGSVLQTRIQGDCHFSNFGFLTEEGSHSDRVIWCPNDYDDACGGPAVWDLLRFAASLPLAAAHARGVLAGTYEGEEIDEDGEAPDDEQALAAIGDFLHAYASKCSAIAENPDERDTVPQGFGKKHALGKLERKALKRTAGGKKFDTKSTLAKAVEIHDGRLMFRDNPDKYVRLSAEEVGEIVHAFRPYVDDEILDVVRRIGQGTGSLGMDRFYLLIGPGTLDERRLYLNHIVEVKQQRPAAAIRHFPDIDPINRMTAAHLTIDCQRTMQRRPDMVLDEVMWRGSPWLVRSRHHAREGLDPEDLVQEDPGKFLGQVATACGAALALAHSRGDRRSTDFEQAMVKALCARTRDILAEAAMGYAARAAEDWRLMRHMLGHGG